VPNACEIGRAENHKLISYYTLKQNQTGKYVRVEINIPVSTNSTFNLDIFILKLLLFSHVNFLVEGRDSQPGAKLSLYG